MNSPPVGDALVSPRRCGCGLTSGRHLNSGKDCGVKSKMMIACVVGVLAVSASGGRTRHSRRHPARRFCWQPNRRSGRCGSRRRRRRRDRRCGGFVRIRTDLCCLSPAGSSGLSPPSSLDICIDTSAKTIEHICPRPGNWQLGNLLWLSSHVCRAMLLLFSATGTAFPGN